MPDYHALAGRFHSAIADKGYTGVRVRFEIESVNAAPDLYMTWRNALDESESKWFFHHELSTDEHVICARFFEWLSSLPPREDAAKETLAREMAKLLDKARRCGIDETWTSPIADIVKKLSDNILLDLRPHEE